MRILQLSNRVVRPRLSKEVKHNTSNFIHFPPHPGNGQIPHSPGISNGMLKFQINWCITQDTTVKSLLTDMSIRRTPL